MLRYKVIARKSPLDESVKYYAQLAPVQPVDLNEISDIIASQCTVTPHDTKAVLSALEEQIFIAMREGRSVRLGDLGSFHPTLTSTGTNLKKEFTAASIDSVRCRFTASSRMRFELSKTNPKVKFLQEIEEPPTTAPDGQQSV